MEAKPLTREAIALTEKKMDMTLDDIIKLSKNTSNKVKNMPRVLNKSQKPMSNAAKEKAFKVRQYMDSRSSLRQGVIAQRRSDFWGNRFPLAAVAACRASVAPFRFRASDGSRMSNLSKPRFGAPSVQRRSANGGFAAKAHQQQQEYQGNAVTKQRPETLDSLFANMKEQRLRVLSHQNNAVQRNGGGRQRMPWGRARFGN